MGTLYLVFFENHTEISLDFTARSPSALVSSQSAPCIISC